jgi:UDP-glucuronate 4-epimerase
MNQANNKILVTGAAGFIGMHLTERLIQSGWDVIGIDELNSYYLPELKSARLERLLKYKQFKFEKLDVSNYEALSQVFRDHKFRYVIHLAAQAGVRYSLKDPFAYQRSNLNGMTSVLEACRNFPVEHLLYASSSSVYGGNTTVPFSEAHAVDRPMSFYAATKRANELMATSYSHLFGIPATALRFFTVYGPMGRPDMAYWMFTESLLGGRPIKVFGEGKLSRDFTYCDDITSAIEKLLPLPPGSVAAETGLIGSHRILNVGNSSPHDVNELILTLENLTGRKAIREDLPIPPGDVMQTYADPSRLQALTDFRPTTKLHDGLKEFVVWYRKFFNK